MTPAARHAVVRTADGGWLLQPLDAAGAPAGDGEAADDEAALVAAVSRIERALAPRWVWRSTAHAYRVLARHGVRVARCHDLAHTERLLLGQEGRWADLRSLDASGKGDSGTADEPDLFGQRGAPAPGVPDDVTLLAQHADQLGRVRRVADRLPGFALLVAAESASALLAVEMGLTGLPWDGATHDEILTDLLGPRPAQGRPARLQALAEELATVLDDERLNPDSPVDLLRSLRRAGLAVTSTGRHELARQDHPAVPLVRRFKELARLWTANGWAWRETWVRDGRFRPEYVPAGVVSGRWATRGGGALQIPKAVRGAVRATAGRVLVVADAGQLEPRVLAALSGDPGMVNATRGADLYADIAAQALGRADARAEAKLALLSAMYGGGAGSPALAALRRRFGQALALLEDAARAGEDGASVHSLLGRVCPPAGQGWLDGVPEAVAGSRARARGRFTRNFVVQASAADWAAVLIAGLRTRLARLKPVGGWTAQIVLFQHDEVIVEVAAEQADQVVAAIGPAGAEATRLVLGEVGVHIPLEAAVVTSYADKP